MKTWFLTLFLPLAVRAQTVDVNKIDTNSSPGEATTIQIQKGAPLPYKTPYPVWEVHEGTTDIQGDESATGRDAKDAWKKACDDWKKEFRADNKENKILTMSCGKAECSGEAGSKVCTSKATYKIKTRTDS